MTTNSTAGTIPSGDWKSIARKWRATGEWGEYASRYASNGLVTIMQPDRGDAGHYILGAGMPDCPNGSQDETRPGESGQKSP
jgi:hypothetical protein